MISSFPNNHKIFDINLKEKKVLIIDDDPEIINLITSILERDQIIIESCFDENSGRNQIQNQKFDLILLDVNLNGKENGFALLKEIKKNHQEFTSVILVSANEDVESIVKGLNEGADDYIVKPFYPAELLARIRAQLRIKHLTDELRLANLKLQELVEIDDLTQLFNMRSIYQKIDLEIDRARRYQRNVCVIMMDMDHFKYVNDGHDHLFGSFVLSQIGQIIRHSIRTIDIAARYGGDEFLIMLTETYFDGALLFCERLRKKIEHHVFENNQDRIQLTASMGFAIINPAHYFIDAQNLVRQADHALYEAKESGRNQVRYRIINDPKIKKTN